MAYVKVQKGPMGEISLRNTNVNRAQERANNLQALKSLPAKKKPATGMDMLKAAMKPFQNAYNSYQKSYSDSMQKRSPRVQRLIKNESGY